MVEEDTPNIAQWAYAWVLYLLGILALRIDIRFGFGYRAYGRLMAWSSGIQGPTGFGPWNAYEV